MSKEVGDAASGGEIWHISAEEQTPEQIHGLGRFVYISMFTNRSRAVMNELYRIHEAEIGAETWTSEYGPLHWPAEKFVEQSAVQNGMNLPMLRRLCDAASREIAKQIAQGIEDRRSSILTPHIMDRENGLDRRRESLDFDIALAEQISENGLGSAIIEHESMLRLAGQYSIDLGLRPAQGSDNKVVSSHLAEEQLKVAEADKEMPQESGEDISSDRIYHDQSKYAEALTEQLHEDVLKNPRPKPWGVSGDDLTLSDYYKAFNEMAVRTPQFVARLIRTTPYLVQLESAEGYPEGTAELVHHRRFERRWLRSHLGKQEFLRQRRAGELQHLFGWPRSVPRGDSERINWEEELDSRHPIFQDDVFDDGVIDTKTFEEIELLDRQDS